MSEITGFTADTTAALPLYVLDREQFAAWKDGQPRHPGLAGLAGFHCRCAQRGPAARQ